jgi:hypothetical protein
MPNTPTTEIQFGINSYQALSGIMSSERLVNFYAELAPPNSPFRGMLVGTAGLKEWKDLGRFEPVYGSITLGNFLYVVCGLGFYQIDSSKTATLKGNLGGTPDRVMMTHNRTQITILLSNGDAYYYDTVGDTFAQITDPDYQPSSSVTTLNGFTIFSKENSDQFFISALNDTTSYSSLDFATAESEPDNIVRVYAVNNELWIFGESTIEIWGNTGNATFPFERIRGTYIEVGCQAKFSICHDQEGIFWLGDDNSIYQGIGYQAKRISTHPIEYKIENYSVRNDAFAFFYIQEGHRFYTLSFDDADKTWCYDTTTELWHERSSRNPSNSQNERWRINSLSFFAGLNLVGDKNTGKIYELDLNTYTEDGKEIVSEVISATIFKNYSRMHSNRLTLVMDTGVGIDGSGQGDNPEIMLQVSNDGGKTYSEEMWQPIGEIGNYETEVSWNKIGYGRSLILKVKISDPISRRIVGVYLDQEVGYS